MGMKRFKIRKNVRQRLIIDTDAIFSDSLNLPGFDKDKLEGRVVSSLKTSEIYLVGAIFLLFATVVLFKSYSLQIVRGDEFNRISEENRLEYRSIFAQRGIITDRYDTKLAWNTLPEVIPATEDEVVTDTVQKKYEFPHRKYIENPAFAHLIGYVEYPKKDSKGNWWSTKYVPKSGLEFQYDAELSGINGKDILEVDSRGKVISHDMIDPPVDGKTLQLSLDAHLQELLFSALQTGVERSHFKGGAGVVMDVHTGEVLAITSYPSYDLNVFTEKNDPAQIQKYLNDTRSVFLNRAVQGAYSPGSIIKPFMAIAALEESIVTPEWGIVSTGSISLPNPYTPSKPSIFRDWKAHGWVDMRHAIAVSSDVYFYVIGGGYQGQKGMGIAKIDEWARNFGFGALTGIAFPNEVPGQIPTPEWKKQAFKDEQRWNIGNTYHSSIGQYGWLATPLQAVQYTAAVANGGTLITPTLKKGEQGAMTHIPMTKTDMSVIHDGMRLSASIGTAKSLKMAGLDLAGKTGTAQVGARNEKMHSWVIGFWPSQKPQFAFVMMMENAPANTLVGSAPSMRPFFETLIREKSPYIDGKYPQKIIPEKSVEIEPYIETVPSEETPIAH